MDITYMIKTIEKTILEQHVGNQSVREFTGIILLKDQKKLLENYIYIGEYETGIRLLSRCPGGSSFTLFLSAAGETGEIRLPYCGRHNVIASALDVFDLYNRVNIIVQNYLHWTNTLREALCLGQSLPEVMEAASGMIESPLYLLNPGYRLILGSKHSYFDHPLKKELEERGQLPAELVTSLVTNLQDDGSSPSSLAGTPAGIWSRSFQGVTLLLCPVFKDTRHLATILLAVNPKMSGIDFEHLLLDFAEIVSHTLLENLETLLNQDAIFTSFLQDMIEERITEDEEINHRLSALLYPVNSFCSFIEIQIPESPEQSTRYEVLLQQLLDLFPQTNMSVFHGKLVILHSQKERPVEKLDFDYDRLAELLEPFDGHAGISNASRHRNRLRTLYTIADATIALGRPLHRFSESERVFSYEDYSMYYIIDLCARKYMESFHHNDLIYLIHPSIIRICRYDDEHKSNLRDVLYYYLLSGCNLNKTASSMFMHRNTILNKLNKISEITEIPLEDGYIRHRMIMSCLIMKYYEDVLHQKVRL